MAQEFTYTPGLVPDDPRALNQFLFDELQRISTAIASKPSGGRSILLTPPDPVQLDADIQVPLVNFGEQLLIKDSINTLDRVAGTIGIGKSAPHQFMIWLSGTIASPNINDTITIFIVDDLGAQFEISTFLLGFNQQVDYSSSAVGVANVVGGRTYHLEIVSTATMGLLTFTSATFAIDEIT